MTQPISNGGAVNARLGTLERDFSRHERLIETNAAKVAELSYVPQQLRDLKEDILELKNLINDAAKAQKQTTEWWENFRLSNKSLTETKTQNVKSGYLAIIGLGGSLLIFLLGVIANAALKVIK